MNGHWTRSQVTSMVLADLSACLVHSLHTLFVFLSFILMPSAGSGVFVSNFLVGLYIPPPVAAWQLQG